MTQTGRIPEFFQVFHPTLHSDIVQHHKALLVQPIADHRFGKEIYISAINNTNICFQMLKATNLIPSLQISSQSFNFLCHGLSDKDNLKKVR